MKKTTLLLMMAILLFSGVAFARPLITENLTNGYKFEIQGTLQVDLLNQAVATSSTVIIDLHNIAHYDSLWCTVNAVSAGNATTVNVSWRDRESFSIEYASEILTSGCDNVITSMRTGDARLTYNNNYAAPTTVTMSIFCADD